MIPLVALSALAIVLFVLGLFLVITRRNAIMAILGVELLLNAANLNFVGFNRLYPENHQGQGFALFIIVIAAAEAAVGLALVLNLYRRYGHVDLARIRKLRG